MKKILFLLALFFCLTAGAQVFPTGAVLGPATTTEMNAISSVRAGQVLVNTTTGTLWWYNGSIWVDLGVSSGLAEADIDTFNELNTIVADETLSKASDIGVTIQPYNANTDTDSTDDLTTSDLIDDDTFATATSTNVASAESIKAYVDANSGTGITDVVDDTSPQLGGDLDALQNSLENIDIIVSDESRAYGQGQTQSGTAYSFHYYNPTNSIGAVFGNEAAGSGNGQLRIADTGDATYLGGLTISNSHDYIFDGTYDDDDDVPRKSDVDAAISGSGSGDVTAASNIADNVLVRGDGGTKGVQGSNITIDDSDSVSGMVLDADNNTVSNIGGAEITDGSIDEADLDTSTNASLDLADSSVQDLTDLGITSTATELNYTDGVTANIQTQLDNKVVLTGGNQFPTRAEKVSPVSADLLLLEDSENSYVKRRVQVGNLPGGTSLLPEYEINVGGSPYTTDSNFENKIVTTGGTAGSITVNLADDIDYDYDDGTILRFFVDGDASVTISHTTISDPILTGNEYLEVLKEAADTWKVINRSSTSVKIKSDASVVSGSSTISNMVQKTYDRSEASPATGTMLVQTDVPIVETLTGASLDFADVPFYLDNTTADNNITFTGMAAWMEGVIDIDQTSEPTFTASGYTVSAWDGTLAFASNTAMRYIFQVQPDGSTIKFYRLTL